MRLRSSPATEPEFEVARRLELVQTGLADLADRMSALHNQVRHAAMCGARVRFRGRCNLLAGHEGRCRRA